MPARVVVYDACVLYPAPLRSFLIYLAQTGIVAPRWTDMIHAEWMRSVVRDYPDIAREKVERVRDLMNAAVPNCLVSGYEELIETLVLPDPDDRHVLAAAIHGRAEIIVTFNLRDFPDEALKAFDIQAQHPDDFVATLFDVAPAVVCATVKSQRESLRNPPKTAEELLATLESQGLVQSVACIRTFLADL